MFDSIADKRNTVTIGYKHHDKNYSKMKHERKIPNKMTRYRKNCSDDEANKIKENPFWNPL